MEGVISVVSVEDEVVNTGDGVEGSKESVQAVSSLFEVVHSKMVQNQYRVSVLVEVVSSGDGKEPESVVSILVSVLYSGDGTELVGIEIGTESISVVSVLVVVV